MITIYNQNEKDFSHNGLGILLATEATVTEELNGLYELAMVCPRTNKNLSWEYIGQFKILRAPTPKGFQLFRIYSTNITLQGGISVNARHVFYDALYNLIEQVSPVSELTGNDAMKLVYSKTSYPHNFTISSDITGKTASFSYTNINPVGAILGDEGLAALFGGELLRDNFNIALKAHLGEDRGFTTRYRKNLVGLDLDSNIETTATRIKPYINDSNGFEIALPEKYIDSPNIDMYPFPLYSAIEFNDISIGKDGMTLAGAYTEMRKRCHEIYTNGGDIPSVNAKIEFALLKNTVGYEEYAPLEEIYIGDTVSAIYEEMYIDLTAKCISYSYDALLERYIKIELGSFREDFAVSTDRAISGISSGTSSIGIDLAEIIKKLETHVHNNIDGTSKISYKDLKDKP